MSNICVSLQISHIRFGICFGYCSVKEIQASQQLLFSEEDLFVTHNKGSFPIFYCAFNLRFL